MSLPETPDPKLLQALEHILEGVKRTSDVLATPLDKMGERTVFRHHDRGLRSHLQKVKTDRLRMEELLRGLWTQVEKQ
jgi:hypothetical protein